MQNNKNLGFRIIEKDLSFDNDVLIKDVKKYGDQAKLVTVRDAVTNSDLYFLTPALKTWGTSDYKDNQKYKATIIMDNIAFLEQIKYLEDCIIETAIKRSFDWFGSEQDADIIRDNFKSCLHYSTDKETFEIKVGVPPSFQIGFSCYNGEWKDLLIYNTNKECLFPNEDINETPIELIKKGDIIKSIIVCVGVWIVGSSFGLKWQYKQIVVSNQSLTTTGCLIEFETEPEQDIIDLVLTESVLPESVLPESVLPESVLTESVLTEPEPDMVLTESEPVLNEPVVTEDKPKKGGKKTKA